MKKIAPVIGYIRNNWIGLGVIGLLWLVVVVTNFSNSRWLMGWDNVQADLNPGLHLKRSFFAAWQEYQGLGLAGGMAHAADLGRSMIFVVLDVLLPAMYIRWVWFFGLLLLGPIGVYVLLRRLMAQVTNFGNVARLGGIVGGVYYLMNLATVQTFYIPLETFVAFFGFLPWLIWLSFRYLDRGKWSDLLWYAVLSTLAAGSFYVQTLFVVYCILLGIVILARWVAGRTREDFIKGILLIVVTLAVHLYWLLPVGYFTINHAQVTVDAKQNQLSTIENELMNVGFGGLDDVALLKGFWFEYGDFIPGSSDQAYLFDTWRLWVGNVGWVGYLIFILSMIGLIWIGLRSKVWWRYIGIVWMLTVFVMMMRQVFPFGYVYNLISDVFPLFGQMFRSAFTKWSLAGSITYSLGLGGVVVLIGSRSQKAAKVFGIGVIALMLIVSWPIFKGELIHPQMKQAMPNEYADLFEFFEEKPVTERIAHFPIQTVWGWNYYDWGYRGSGFLWYGIEQPILDRAFDVWSQENESYYHQMATALNGCPQTEDQQNEVRSQQLKKCSEDLRRIFDKYEVRFVLLDKHVEIPGQNETLLRFDELEEVMGEMGATLEFDQGEIKVWDIGEVSYGEGEVYRLVDIDAAYTRKDVVGEQGDFITAKQDDGKIVSGEVVYPFANVYREEAVDVSFVDSGFGGDIVRLESEQLYLGEGQRIILPGMAKGFGVTLQGEVRYVEGGVSVVLEPGISVFWNDEEIVQGMFEKELFVEVKDSPQKVLVSIEDEIIEVEQGGVVRIDGVASSVGQSIEVKVFDAGRVETIISNPDFWGVSGKKCWERDGYVAEFDEMVLGEYKEFRVKDASICLPMRLSLNEDESGLIRVNLPYKSERARPHFCVTSEGLSENGCLNDEVFYQEQAAPDGDEIERYVLKEKGENYWVDIIARSPETAGDEWSLGYKPPEIEYWPVLAEVNTLSEWWETYNNQHSFKVGGEGVLAIELKLEPEKIEPDLLSQNKLRNCDVFGRGEVKKESSEMKFADGRNGIMSIFYSAMNRGAACDTVVFNDISTLREYLVRFKGENVGGRSLKLYLNNQSSGNNDLEILLNEGDFDQAYGVMAWPGYKEDGYVLNLETRSFGQEKSVNRLDRIMFYPVSLGWLARVFVDQGENDDVVNIPKISRELVEKWGTSHYKYQITDDVWGSGDVGGLLTFDQGFDEGWEGYLMNDPNSKTQILRMMLPWWFGEKLEQVKVNGWANGFVVNENEQSGDEDLRKNVVIVYWPQYLEWVGLVMLVLISGILTTKVVKERRSDN